MVPVTAAAAVDAFMGTRRYGAQPLLMATVRVSPPHVLARFRAVYQFHPPAVAFTISSPGIQSYCAAVSWTFLVQMYI